MFPLRLISSGCEAKPNNWSKRSVRRFPSSTTCVESETMSDTEEAPPPAAPQAVSAGPHAPPPPQIYNFPKNFPIPAAMVCRGDVPANWEFAKKQWQDYEVATRLDQRNQLVRSATFHCVVGKECLQIFRNHNLALVKLLPLHHSKHWRIIFSPSETWFTKSMCLILVVKHPTKLFTILFID